MSEAKLKSCPFCGIGSVEIIHFGRHEWGLRHLGKLGCPVGGVRYYHSRRDATSAWNRRTE